MGSKLFVGGLAWATNDESLAAHFEQCGEVIDAKVVTERDTGRSRGFGFVTFADEASAQSAKETLHGSSLDGREIRVDVRQNVLSWRWWRWWRLSWRRWRRRWLRWWQPLVSVWHRVIRCRPTGDQPKRPRSFATHLDISSTSSPASDNTVTNSSSYVTRPKSMVVTRFNSGRRAPSSRSAFFEHLREVDRPAFLEQPAYMV